MEALQTPFGIHKRARGLREWRDRQQHVADVQIGLERTEGHDHIGVLQAGRAHGCVFAWLNIQQQCRFQASGQHRCRVQPAGAWQCLNQLCAHRVGCFGQVTDTRSRLLTYPLGDRQQTRCLLVMSRGITQQDGLALTRQQGLRHGTGLRGDLDRNWRRHGLGFCHSGCNPCQRNGPVTCIRTNRVRHRQSPVLRRCPQDGHLRTFACGLADALGKQRMVLAKVGAHHQHTIQHREIGNGHTQPASRTRFSGIGDIGHPQARIDIGAAQSPHQCARKEQLFHRAVWTGHETDGRSTMIGLHLAQTIGHVFQRGLPVDLFPLTPLLEHGLGQAIGPIQGLVTEAITIGNPALVDSLVFQGHHTHDLVGLDLDDQVGPGGVVRADALAPRQFPGAGLIAEGFAGQRTHRADVDHVARQLGVHRVAHEGFNL